MVEAAPAAAFIAAEPNLFLQFQIIALDPPAEFGRIDHALQQDVGWQCEEPIVVRFGCFLRPLDQQPFFRGRSHPQAGKSRGQCSVAAVPSFDLLPGVSGEPRSQCLDRDRLMRRVTMPPCRALAASGPECWRQWRLAWPPDRRGGQDAGHAVCHRSHRPGHQYYSGRHTSQRLAHLLQRDLRLGLEVDVTGHPGFRPANRVIDLVLRHIQPIGDG
jgi:hypothetical protein